LTRRYIESDPSPHKSVDLRDKGLFIDFISATTGVNLYSHEALV